MKIELVKEFSPGELQYDNTLSLVPVCNINIDGETVTINFNNIIETQFTGGELQGDLYQIRTLLNLGIYSKAPNGGFVNFYKVKGDKGKIYVIYSGINEVSNSHYKVNVYGLFLITEQ